MGPWLVPAPCLPCRHCCSSWCVWGWPVWRNLPCPWGRWWQPWSSHCTWDGWQASWAWQPSSWEIWRELRQTSWMLGCYWCGYRALGVLSTAVRWQLCWAAVLVSALLISRGRSRKPQTEPTTTVARYAFFLVFVYMTLLWMLISATKSQCHSGFIMRIVSTHVWPSCAVLLATTLVYKQWNNGETKHKANVVKSNWCVFHSNIWIYNLAGTCLS